MSLFDKFVNAASKLEPMIQAEEMPQAKILRDDVAQKLQQRHQEMMTYATKKQPTELPRNDQQDSDHPSRASSATNGDDNADAAAASNDNNAAPVQDNFLVFGGGGGARQRETKSGASAAASAMLASKKDASSTSFDDAAAPSEHYLAAVGAYTYVAAESEINLGAGFAVVEKDKLPQSSANTRNAPHASHTLDATITFRHTDAKIAPVTVYVPLWSAHRFFPVQAVYDHARSQLETRTTRRPPQIQQIASALPFSKHFCGYSPIEAIALHQEIMDFFEWLRPTEGEVFVRRYVEQQVCTIARNLYPECDPQVFGSMTTGLLLPYSDIDISLLGPKGQDSPEDVLLKVARQVTVNKLCEGHAPQVILKTRVPLVKYTSSVAPIDVDISVNAGEGHENTAWVTRHMLRFPEAKYLILLLKFILNQRDLNEPYRGGVGSFACSLLVINFLQHHPIYTTDCPRRNSYGLGRLFVDMLQYFGTIGFNPQKVGISLRVGGENDPPAYFWRDEFSTEMLTRRMPGQLAVEDPTKLDNNAASSVRSFPFIQQAFEGAFLLLTAKTQALHSLLAPAFVFPHPEQLYNPPTTLFVSAQAAQMHLNTMQPINDYVSKRPTLLSRIIHADTRLVQKRVAVERAFAKLQLDTLSNEGKMFAQVVAQARATKNFASLTEVKTRSRYDRASNTHGPVGDKAGKVLARHPFAMGYGGYEAHNQYLEQQLQELRADFGLAAETSGEVEKHAASSPAIAAGGVGRGDRARVRRSREEAPTERERKAENVPTPKRSQQLEPQHQQRQQPSQQQPKGRDVQGGQPKLSQPQRQPERKAQQQKSKRLYSDDDDDQANAYASWQNNNS